MLRNTSFSIYTVDSRAIYTAQPNRKGSEKPVGWGEINKRTVDQENAGWTEMSVESNSTLLTNLLLLYIRM